MKKYFKQNTKFVILLVVCAVLDSVAIAGIPLITKYFIENIPSLDTKLVLIFSGAYVLDVALILSFEYLVKILSAKLYRNISCELRKDLFSNISNFTYKDFYAENTDYYKNLILNDVNILYADYFDCLFSMIISIISLVVYSVVAIFVSPILGGVIILVSVLTLLVPRLVGKNLAEKRSKESEATKNYMATLKDLLDGYNLNNKYTKKQFEGVHNISVKKREQTSYEYTKYRSAVNIISGLSLYIVNIVTFIVGLILINNSLVTLASFIAIIAYVDYIALPSRDIIYQIIGLKSSKEIRNKIEVVLNYEKKDIVSLDEFKNAINVEINKFEYNDKVILKNIELQFEKNKKYAIIGKSGSGKTTFINLLLGKLIDFDGKVLYDNTNIFDVDVSKIVSEINQNTFIFNASFSDNVTLFNTYTSEKLEDYIKEIKAEQLLRENLGEGGREISGGEKQKIALLRALIKESEVIVCDEIFDGIDEVTAKEIKDFVFSKDVTYISITHDLSKENLNYYDYVVVLKNSEMEIVKPIDLDYKMLI